MACLQSPSYYFTVPLVRRYTQVGLSTSSPTMVESIGFRGLRSEEAEVGDRFILCIVASPDLITAEHFAGPSAGEMCYFLIPEVCTQLYPLPVPLILRTSC